jgi:dolichol-phosphate mannosyltransferase
LRSDVWSIEFADLTDRAVILDLLRRVRPRAILHVAVDQRIHESVDVAEQDRLNTKPLEMLFTGLAEVGGDRFIHTSSAWVLPSGERLNESTRLEPRTPYAVTKARADEFLPLLAERTGIPWINLRLFNIFGRYEPEHRLLPSIVERLSRGCVASVSSGEQIRDFTDVEDIARAYVLALQASQAMCGSTYHIGSGRGVSIREFALTVGACVGERSLIRFGEASTRDQDIACQTADSNHARKLLGWAPSYILEESIERTVHWWLNRWGRQPHRQPRLTAAFCNP